MTTEAINLLREWSLAPQHRRTRYVRDPLIGFDDLVDLTGHLEREGVTHLHVVPVEQRAATGGDVWRCMVECEHPDWPLWQKES